jgi:uncharacterized protein (TIGR03790 family)
MKCSFLLFLLLSVEALAGGGPQNTLVVVNDQSLESLELGAYYRELRSIPERNICHISVPPAVNGFPSSYSISEANYNSLIHQPIQDHIRDNSLSNQVDYVVFSRDIPYKVNGDNGITSAAFYGYRNSPAHPMDEDTLNPYYEEEKAFSRAGRTNDLYISMMLTAWTLGQARDLVDSCVASDGSQPTGTVYLLKTGDIWRNIRYHQFNNVDFLYRFFPGFPSLTNTVGQSSISGKSDVIGYLAGSSSVPSLESNTFLPGSCGDHLTSYGGRLFDSSQMSILDFIKAGACGSYGTVTEPFGIWQKFPGPLSYFWYARGFSLGESYWMSVKNPYNGLFVGDPLCTPFAVPPDVTVTNLTTNQVVSGNVIIGASAQAGAGRTVSRMDMYIDDVLVGEVTNAPPCPGNRLSVMIDGSNVTYDVQAGETLYDTAAGLSSNINALAGLAAGATVHGDRIVLRYSNYGSPGTGITYSATSATGTASRLSVFVTNLTDRLLESEYPARELLACWETNSISATDLLRLVVTLQDGTKSTNEVVGTTNSTGPGMLTSLRNAVNADPSMQGTNGVKAVDYRASGPEAEFWIEARQAGPEGYNIHVDYQVYGGGFYTNYAFSDQMNDNGGDITARGLLLLSCGAPVLPGLYSLDTLGLPDGPHMVRIVAYEGSAVETQGFTELPVVVSNSTLESFVISPTNAQEFNMGDSVTSTVAVTGESGGVTQVNFYVEDKLYASTTNPPYSFVWPTLSYGVGTVAIQARAWDGSGNSAVSRKNHIKIIDTGDADQDLLPDSWERTYFGGIYPYAGTNDPDSDTLSNRDEYVADTVPTDAGSLFSIVDISQGAATGTISIIFISSTNREYDVIYTDQGLSYTGDWDHVFGTPQTGSNGLYRWEDAGDTNRTHPSAVTSRFYRVTVELP